AFRERAAVENVCEVEAINRPRGPGRPSRARGIGAAQTPGDRGTDGPEAEDADATALRRRHEGGRTGEVAWAVSGCEKGIDAHEHTPQDMKPSAIRLLRGEGVARGFTSPHFPSPRRPSAPRRRREFCY